MNEVDTITVVRASAPFWPTFIAILIVVYIAGVIVCFGTGVLMWHGDDRAAGRAMVRRAIVWPLAVVVMLYRIGTSEESAS